MASFEVQAAVSAVANRWEKQASTHMAALERAYAGEQEAEYAASLAEYYAARQQHQAEQQRLNQASAQRGGGGELRRRHVGARAASTGVVRAAAALADSLPSRSLPAGAVRARPAGRADVPAQAGAQLPARAAAGGGGAARASGAAAAARLGHGRVWRRQHLQLAGPDRRLAPAPPGSCQQHAVGGGRGGGHQPQARLRRCRGGLAAAAVRRRRRCVRVGCECAGACELSMLWRAGSSRQGSTLLLLPALPLFADPASKRRPSFRS